MSHTMATIHQGSISNANLISWIDQYNAYTGTSNGYLASYAHTEVALNLFHERAEQITMTQYNKGFVHARVGYAPNANP